MKNIFPPGAVADFKKKCIRCGKCAAVCPTGAITIRKGAFPQFTGPCVFCGKCVAACPTGAIKAFKKIGTCKIDPSKCVAWDEKKGHCLVCWEWCPQGAIKITNRKNNKNKDPRDFTSKPIIDPKLCNGCCSCLAGCPHQAIIFQRKENKKNKKISA